MFNLVYGKYYAHLLMSYACPSHVLRMSFVRPLNIQRSVYKHGVRCTHCIWHVVQYTIHAVTTVR